MHILRLYYNPVTLSAAQVHPNWHQNVSFLFLKESVHKRPNVSQFYIIILFFKITYIQFSPLNINRANTISMTLIIPNHHGSTPNSIEKCARKGTQKSPLSHTTVILDEGH